LQNLNPINPSALAGNRQQGFDTGLQRNTVSRRGKDLAPGQFFKGWITLSSGKVWTNQTRLSSEQRYPHFEQPGETVKYKHMQKKKHFTLKWWLNLM